MSRILIEAVVNGEALEFLADPTQTLLDALRDELGLTGSKEGCGSGDCGACSVTLNGRLVCSCLVLAPEAQGTTIGTIEGLAVNGVMHPLQQQFLEHAALQCGFCTPAMLMAAQDLLQQSSEPSREQIREHLSGNYCRCTGYQAIVDAVEATALARAGRTS